MKTRNLTLIVAVFMAASVLCLCSGCEETNASTAQQEQARTEANQQVLLKTQPPVALTWSLERENINKRTELWNDENKVSYIYLVSFGRIMAFYPIKGKVSSVNSQITNPEQAVMRRYVSGGSRHTFVMPSPAEDGSYGTNGDGVFFFTTSGAYVEWAGEYMLCDQPLKLSTPPVAVMDI